MSSKLLQLSLYVVTVIQLTSSQSTYDVIQQQNDVNSCGSSGHVLSQLMSAMSQLQITMLQLQAANSQLQRDVAEIKARVNAAGKLRKYKEGQSRQEAF